MLAGPSDLMVHACLGSFEIFVSMLLLSSLYSQIMEMDKHKKLYYYTVMRMLIFQNGAWNLYIMPSLRKYYCKPIPASQQMLCHQRWCSLMSGSPQFVLRQFWQVLYLYTYEDICFNNVTCLQLYRYVFANIYLYGDMHACIPYLLICD